MILKGDQGTVRAINRALVLNLLRQYHTLGRQELAELTNLSAAAIGGVVAELIEEGLVVQTRNGQPRGGRPPVLLEVAYNNWYAAGVKVTEDYLEVVLTDLSTAVLAQQRVRLSKPTPEALTHCVRGAIDRLMAQTRHSYKRLVGIGIGLAGIIDPVQGICVYSPFLHWRNVPVKQIMENEFRRPVWVDNDVNALAVAEMLFGYGKGARNFVVVTVGRGIGAGLVIGAEIYRGATGGAGELGHTVLIQDGRPCECGKQGCLEAYASEPALIQLTQERFPELSIRAIQDLLRQLENGHSGIETLIAKAGQQLGLALANLVNLFNPELLVVGGEGVRLGKTFFDPMEATMRRNVFSGLGNNLAVHIHPWGDDTWARGAAGLSIQKEVFARPL